VVLLACLVEDIRWEPLLHFLSFFAQLDTHSIRWESCSVWWELLLHFVLGGRVDPCIPSILFFAVLTRWECCDICVGPRTREYIPHVDYHVYHLFLPLSHHRRCSRRSSPALRAVLTHVSHSVGSSDTSSQQVMGPGHRARLFAASTYPISPLVLPLASCRAVERRSSTIHLYPNPSSP
jgi:hypothetical protein